MTLWIVIMQSPSSALAIVWQFLSCADGSMAHCPLTSPSKLTGLTLTPTGRDSYTLISPPDHLLTEVIT